MTNQSKEQQVTESIALPEPDPIMEKIVKDWCEANPGKPIPLGLFGAVPDDPHAA